MQYHLKPPFFTIEPQTSFDDAWEEFCRQLLNLEHHTTEIRGRKAPDFGIDLIWEKEGIAFQCKTVENGRAGSFNIGDTIESIQRALYYQSTTGWQKYILCINIDLTGKQELKLRQQLPDISFYTRGYWTDLCKKFPHQVADRFSILVKIPPLSTIQELNSVYIRNYTQNYQIDTSKPLLPIFFYSKRRRQIFELEVPPNLIVADLLLLVKNLFNLTDPVTTYSDINISFSLKYTLIINNQEVPSYKKLSELVSEDRPLVTLLKTAIFYQQSSLTELQDLEHTRELKTWIEIITLPAQESIQSGVKRFLKKIYYAFTIAIGRWK